jgi:dATP pyrophosphohydrolase
MNQHAQFLVLRRKEDRGSPLHAWQAIHGQVNGQETAVEAARRRIHEVTGLTPSSLYSADYVGQFYDSQSDVVVLAPAFAARFDDDVLPMLASEYIDYAWCDLEETTARLPMSAQRWAVRHIYATIALGGEESALYQL